MRSWNRTEPRGDLGKMSTAGQLLVGGERTTGESIRSQNGVLFTPRNIVLLFIEFLAMENKMLVQYSILSLTM